jgi:hypothetical protein
MIYREDPYGTLFELLWPWLSGLPVIGQRLFGGMFLEPLCMLLFDARWDVEGGDQSELTNMFYTRTVV